MFGKDLPLEYFVVGNSEFEFGDCVGILCKTDASSQHLISGQRLIVGKNKNKKGTEVLTFLLAGSDNSTQIFNTSHTSSGVSRGKALRSRPLTTIVESCSIINLFMMR